MSSSVLCGTDIETKCVLQGTFTYTEMIQFNECVDSINADMAFHVFFGFLIYFFQRHVYPFVLQLKDCLDQSAFIWPDKLMPANLKVVQYCDILLWLHSKGTFKLCDLSSHSANGPSSQKVQIVAEHVGFYASFSRRRYRSSSRQADTVLLLLLLLLLLLQRLLLLLRRMRPLEVSLEPVLVRICVWTERTLDPRGDSVLLPHVLQYHVHLGSLEAANRTLILLLLMGWLLLRLLCLLLLLLLLQLALLFLLLC